MIFMLQKTWRRWSRCRRGFVWRVSLYCRCRLFHMRFTLTRCCIRYVIMY